MSSGKDLKAVAAKAAAGLRRLLGRDAPDRDEDAPEAPARQAPGAAAAKAPAQPVAPEPAAAAEPAPEPEAEPAPAPEPEPEAAPEPAPDVQPEIARLEAEAKAAAQAAYEACNPGHGKPPAPNAGELLAAAADAQRRLAAAKRS